MTDFDESLHPGDDAPLAALCLRVLRLARRDQGGYAVRWATTDPARGVVRVTVGDERARERVLEVAPGAEVTVE